MHMHMHMHVHTHTRTHTHHTHTLSTSTHTLHTHTHTHTHTPHPPTQHVTEWLKIGGEAKLEVEYWYERIVEEEPNMANVEIEDYEYRLGTDVGEDAKTVSPPGPKTKKKTPKKPKTKDCLSPVPKTKKNQKKILNPKTVSPPGPKPSLDLNPSKTPPKPLLNPF